MLPEQRWLWPARVLRVIDGDTMVCVIDRGFGDQHGHDDEFHLRLADCWAEEIRGAQATELGRRAALEAQNWVAAGSLRPEPWPFLVETYKTKSGPERQSLGRYIARIWRLSDGSALNEWLVSQGLATRERP